MRAEMRHRSAPMSENAQTLSMAAKQYKKSPHFLKFGVKPCVQKPDGLAGRKDRTDPVGHLPAASGRGGGGCQNGRELSRRRWIAKRGTGSGALHGDGSAAGSEKPAKRPDSITIHDRIKAKWALRQLAILLGKSGTSITLEIPAVSATELASMNLDADRAAAVVASSSVKISQTILRNRRCSAQAAPPADRGSRERRKRLSG